MTLHHYNRRHEIEQALHPQQNPDGRARIASIYMLIHASTAGFAHLLNNDILDSLDRERMTQRPRLSLPPQQKPQQTPRRTLRDII
eukprot:300841-Prorocentrum_lima.AAC.1